MTAPSTILESGYGELMHAFATFMNRELVPLAPELGEGVNIPPKELRDYVRRRSVALGFYAVDYPEELGGAGMPFSAAVQLHHAAGRSGCPLAPYALAGSDGPSPLLTHGTEEQIERYLIPLVRGEATRCLALTEPQGGSDAFHLSTTATCADGGWVLDGRKIYVGNAGHADFAIVIASTERGASAFVVDMDNPGLRIGQRYDGMSGEPLFEVVLHGAWVNDQALIGGDRGLGSATEWGIDALSRGRLVVAAQCNGISEYALRLGVEYAKERRAFGKRIGAYQHVQEHLVRSRAEVEAAKLLTLACARLVDEGKDGPEHAALAKLTASETAIRVVDRALQVHGAIGWMRGHPLEFLYRYVRMTTLIEGTSELQKVLIARAMGLD